MNRLLVVLAFLVLAAPAAGQQTTFYGCGVYSCHTLIFEPGTLYPGLAQEWKITGHHRSLAGMPLTALLMVVGIDPAFGHLGGGIWGQNYTEVYWMMQPFGAHPPGSYTPAGAVVQAVSDNGADGWITEFVSVTHVTPEPGSLLLLATGLGGVVAHRGRRRLYR